MNFWNLLSIGSLKDTKEMGPHRGINVTTNEWVFGKTGNISFILSRNWKISKSICNRIEKLFWKRVRYEPYFLQLISFFNLQLTLLQIREKCISKVLDYKLVQQWSLQKNPMIDCLQWKGVNQQSFQKCTFENEMIMAVSDKRTLIGQVCYWNYFLCKWSEIPLESELSN